MVRVRKPYVIAEEGDHQVVWLGLEEAELERGVLTNQYLVVDSGEGLLIDPGGSYVFERVYRNVREFVNPNRVKAVFFTHQDPDVVGSLVMLSEFFPNARIYISSLWVRFLPHLGIHGGIEIVEVPDEGGEVPVGKAKLLAIPTHFLHSPGNHTLYDPVTKTLFSGDLGAAVFPRGVWYLFVEDFDKHSQYMKPFHERYLPCREALEAWLSIVSDLEIEVVAPQHGAIFVGENAIKFLEWLKKLNKFGIDRVKEVVERWKSKRVF